MKKNKSVFLKNKPFFNYGNGFKGVNNKMAYVIIFYGINQINLAFDKDKTALNETEKKEFEKLVKDLVVFKREIAEDSRCSGEEFEEFLENLFANVDDEDRYGEVSNKTVSSFRLVSELIDILSNWGSIPDTWAKRSNCLFIK